MHTLWTIGARGLLVTLIVLGPSVGFATTVRAQGMDGGDDPGSEAHGQLEIERHGTLTSAGSFWIEWWPEPAPIPLNKMFAIRFRVLDPDDRQTPITSAVVTASAWMPAHDHGTSLVPQVVSHGDGTATAYGFLLHMEGHWQLKVGVAVEGQMERATFDIDLAP